MITKIQKLSAIHNYHFKFYIVCQLFMITKIQKLSAIHNDNPYLPSHQVVVYDYKDTKIVSNSQHCCNYYLNNKGCLWLQRYKNCQQFTTDAFNKVIKPMLFMITKIQKLSAIHNSFWSSWYSFWLFMITKIQKLSAIHNMEIVHVIKFCVVYDYKDTKIVSNSQPASACNCL